MTTSTHPFTVWLVSQSERDDPMGELARGVAADPDAPDDPDDLLGYLMAMGAPDAMEATHAAIHEWEAATTTPRSHP